MSYNYMYSEQDFQKTLYIGKTIASAILTENYLYLNFTDGTHLYIYDDGQSCCEHRYITCDDDLYNIIDGDILNIEVKRAPDLDDEYVVHEQAFIDVLTTKGFITLTTHNEHNGYYGGFSLTLSEKEPFE